jgi:hypothetical protein
MRALSVIILTVVSLVVVSAAPVSSDTPQTVNGANSIWFIHNFTTGTEFGIGDAALTSPSMTDAYDSAGNIFVDGSLYGAPDPADLTGNTYTAGVVSMSGLDVSMQFYVDPTSDVARQMLILTNPTGSTISAQIRWLSNSGADNDFTILGTSSGDTTFTAGDRWLAAWDTGLNDPVTSFGFFGEGALVAPSLASVNVDSISATYDVTVGAGETVRLLWFYGLSDNPTGGLSLAQSFDFGVNGWNSSLTGLSASDLSQVVNYTPEPSTVSMMGLGFACLVGLIRRRRA